MTNQMQNDDGSWSDAQPMGWQGSGIDWEVYNHRPHRRVWQAVGYDEDVCVAVMESQWRWLLVWKMRRAAAALDGAE